jgi:hypothetical protein
MLMKLRTVLLSVALLLTALAVAAQTANNWQRLFDGKSLTGWERKAVHGGNGESREE